MFSYAHGIDVDVAHGEIFVMSDNSILVFPLTADGNVSTIRVIGGVYTGIVDPIDIAYDPLADELAVANYGWPDGGSIVVFGRTDTGNLPPVRRIGGPNSGIRTPRGIAAGW